ncbi:hypothetical protein J7J47_11850 [Halomonas sp. ISL-60]|uniref:phage tail tip fiber protein n=1 Tax=Halomonas sp. ISL-56 TaxID=2819149 RepID=UPI001BE9AA42|nr:hypothetical protein [Halomonas sp. ISL-56]MBT2772916.1 hypothetical protein [Halomonas sp. ISL-60]MBT2799963.1 hypothetical protein [Halomonas sp. ISL-56]
MNRRRRTLPPVPPKAPSELRPLIAAMTEILETGEGVRGDPLDRKVTLRDLLDSGIGRLKPGMPPGQDGNLDSGTLPPAPDLSIPPAPAGFDAQGGFYGMINLSWTIPGQQYRNHAFTNIFRNEEDNFANAEVIGREAGGFYTDYVRDDAIDPDDPTKLKGYYYWITFTSVADIEGPPNSPNGTYAAPIADLGYVIELLTGEIDADVLAQSLKEEIERIGTISETLNGPESLDGTVANRIAAEREDRIAALDEERSERLEALTFEAQARAQAIQAETENRTTAITQAVEQLELEDGLLALQQNVMAATYDANAASIYSMAQVRINDNEVFATQIDQLFGSFEDNQALILDERQIRINQYSSLATQVGVLSARLDSRPSFNSGFEPGADYDAWSAASGSTISAVTGDVHSGLQSALVTSTSTANPNTGGVRRVIAPATAAEFAGNQIRLAVYAERPATEASAEFALAYQIAGQASQWYRFTPTAEWSFFDVVIDVPAGSGGEEHAIAIWGDTSGGGGGVKVDRALATFAETDIPEVTAAIEQIQQALVDQEQAVASELQAFLSRLDENTASIEQETETRSTQYDALASSITTLTAQTETNTADIVAEREAWSSAVEAVATDVQGLMAAVGDDVVLITDESRARAAEDELLASIQRVMSASRGASSATFYGLEEVRSTDAQATAQRIDGIQVALGDAQAAFEDEINLLASKDQALSSRVTTLQSELDTGIAVVRQEAQTEVSRLDGRITSQASQINTVQSSLEEDVASVQTTMNTQIERVDGELVAIGARYTAQVQVNGLVGGFGVYNDGTQVDAGFDVDRFWIGRTNSDKRKPFIVQGGTVYIDTAFVRNGSIQEGQLGPITIGKLFLNDGTPVTTVGGLIRADAIDVDNLSVAEAARFYGNVQSGNFVTGSSGWRILQNGNVEFNQGQFNGTVNIGNVSGAGALAEKNGLNYEELSGSTAPIVLERANSAHLRVNDWTRPTSTRIDGNKIFTGDAYVDTLQIKGQAVTIPVSTAESGVIQIPSTETSIEILRAVVSASGANVLVSVSFGAYSVGGVSANYRIEVRRNGVLVVIRPGGIGPNSINAHVGGLNSGISIFTVHIIGYSVRIEGRSLGLMATLR